MIIMNGEKIYKQLLPVYRIALRNCNGD
jgi:hypothetical protein